MYEEIICMMELSHLKNKLICPKWSAIDISNIIRSIQILFLIETGWEEKSEKGECPH
jgi:hypothetical protein